MRSALVLNATFEPLSIVPARRAICLVLSDKAEIIEEDGTQIRAETFVMPGPLVIRLRYVVKVPYHRRTAMSDRKSTRLNSSHVSESRMPSSA